MMLLAGGGALLTALAPWCGGDALRHQLTHAGWGGTLTCWDMVMPLFIFIVGASMPFAFAKYRSGGLGTGRMLWRIARRCVLLFILGMLVQGHLATAVPARMSLFCNTLQAIAEGYLIAALCMLLGGVRTQLIACALCLVTYWAALRFIPYGGHAAGLFQAQDNLAIWIDHRLQGRWQDGTPYSWILTSLSFGALTLLGAMGGHIIRRWPSGWRSAGVLAAAALACLGSGWLLSYDTPIIKHIFTTSMVLWSAGWCFALLALFHLLFDKLPALSCLAYPLRVFGSNAILAYLLTQTPGLHGLSLWKSFTYPLLGGVSSLAGPAAQAVYEASSLTLLFLLLLYLHRHHLHLRV